MYLCVDLSDRVICYHSSRKEDEVLDIQYSIGNRQTFYWFMHMHIRLHYTNIYTQLCTFTHTHTHILDQNQNLVYSPCMLHKHGIFCGRKVQTVNIYGSYIK